MFSWIYQKALSSESFFASLSPVISACSADPEEESSDFWLDENFARDTGHDNIHFPEGDQ